MRVGQTKEELLRTLRLYRQGLLSSIDQEAWLAAWRKLDPKSVSAEIDPQFKRPAWRMNKSPSSYGSRSARR